MNTKTKLENFDLNNLDQFEQMQYQHHAKSMNKAEALQILINNVEGDLSQLSEELKEIAEEQEEDPQNMLEAIKYKSDLFYEGIKNEMNALCNKLDYKNGSRFSYNIDRIEHFIKELNEFEIKETETKN